MTTFLVRAFADEAEAVGVGFAVLEIGLQEAKRILERMDKAIEIRSEDKSFATLAYRSCVPEWFGYAEKIVEDLFDEPGYMLVDQVPAHNAEEVIDECTTMVVDCWDNVWWRSWIEHTNVGICTFSLPRTEIEKIVEKLDDKNTKETNPCP